MTRGLCSEAKQPEKKTWNNVLISAFNRVTRMSWGLQTIGNMLSS